MRAAKLSFTAPAWTPITIYKAAGLRANIRNGKIFKKKNMKAYRGGQGAAKRIQVRSRHTTAADTSPSPEGCATHLSVSVQQKNTHLSDTENLVFPQLTWDHLQEPLCIFFLYVSKLQALYSLLQDVMESLQE